MTNWVVILKYLRGKKMHEQSMKYDKLASNIEMHYNSILGFIQGFQSMQASGHPMVSIGSLKDKTIQEETLQQIDTTRQSITGMVYTCFVTWEYVRQCSFKFTRKALCLGFQNPLSKIAYCLNFSTLYFGTRFLIYHHHLVFFMMVHMTNTEKGLTPPLMEE